jgi:hypothetical protein
MPEESKVRVPAALNWVFAPSKVISVSAIETVVELMSSVVPASKVKVPEV